MSSHSLEGRRDKIFAKLTSAEVVDLASLKKSSWFGVPPKFKLTVWQLLLGYLPLKLSERGSFLAQKRAEYLEFFENNLKADGLPNHECHVWRCLEVDARRAMYWPETEVHEDFIQAAQRAAFICHHSPPRDLTCGFTILMAPIVKVFFDAWSNSSNSQEKKYLEADLYWCLTGFLALAPVAGQSHTRTAALRDIMKRKSCIEFDEVIYHIFYRSVHSIDFHRITIEHRIRFWEAYLSSEHFVAMHLYTLSAYISGRCKHIMGSDAAADEQMDVAQILQQVIQRLDTNSGWNELMITTYLAMGWKYFQEDKQIESQQKLARKKQLSDVLDFVFRDLLMLAGFLPEVVVCIIVGYEISLPDVLLDIIHPQQERLVGTAISNGLCCPLAEKAG